MVQICAKVARFDFLAQVAVSGGDDARPTDPFLGFSDSLVFAVLEYAQKLRLQVERKLSNFVEEQRAVGGVLEVTGLGRGRAGECPFGVANKVGSTRFGEIAAQLSA